MHVRSLPFTNAVVESANPDFARIRALVRDALQPVATTSRRTPRAVRAALALAVCIGPAHPPTDDQPVLTIGSTIGSTVGLGSDWHSWATCRACDPSWRQQNVTGHCDLRHPPRTDPLTRPAELGEPPGQSSLVPGLYPIRRCHGERHIAKEPTRPHAWAS